MKNAKSTHYLYVDDEVQNIREVEGVEILSSPEAYEQYKWVRKYFPHRPQAGYFVRVKKSQQKPLTTCVYLTNRGVKQEMSNLLFLDKGVKAPAVGTCASKKKDLCGTHKAQGKIVLKEGATLDYQHVHTWGEKDTVDINYEFNLAKNSQLDYKYKTFFTPLSFFAKNTFNLSENAKANVGITADCKNTSVDIEDIMNLDGFNASGVVNIKIVGREKSNIKTYSTINANKRSKGHLDCQGVITKDSSNISLIPELNCNDKQAELTHEASVGRISEETLHYLRTRGLSEKKAIDLITAGFLRQ